MSLLQKMTGILLRINLENYTFSAKKLKIYIKKIRKNKLIINNLNGNVKSRQKQC